MKRVRFRAYCVTCYNTTTEMKENFLSFACQLSRWPKTRRRCRMLGVRIWLEGQLGHVGSYTLRKKNVHPTRPPIVERWPDFPALFESGGTFVEIGGWMPCLPTLDFKSKKEEDGSCFRPSCVSIAYSDFTNFPFLVSPPLISVSRHSSSSLTVFFSIHSMLNPHSTLP